MSVLLFGKGGSHFSGNRLVGARAHLLRGERWRGGRGRRRCGDGGLDPSGEGWDSESVAYPWILDANGRRYMLYNGNDYGRSGVGLAVYEP